MKINLIFFCANFTRGGAGNSIIRLCKKLNTKKYQISIICLNKFSYLKEIKNTRIKIFKINKSEIIFLIFQIRNVLLKTIKQCSKNIYYSNLNYANALSILFFKKKII